MKSIFITGANGFVGSNLRRFFSTQGFNVVATTRDQPFPPENVFFDVVIHCASQQPRQNLTFKDYCEGNINSLERLLNWMKLHGIKKILTFSSVVIYGNCVTQPIDELSLTSPANDYSRSKLMADELLQQRSKEDRLSSICFRMPSVFGWGQGGGLVDTYYDLACQNKDIEVYSEGKLKRNLLYIDEVQAACNQALGKLDEMDGFRIFLIGSSNSLSMAEIAQYIKNKIHSTSTIHRVAKPAPLPSNWILKLDKAKLELGFSAKTIEEGIDRYCRERGGLSSYD